MTHHGRGTGQLRYKAEDGIRTAGSAVENRGQSRHGRALEHIRTGWRRRAGATGLLLAVIAVTIVVAG
jgi:hypothetical protein